jgi:hypothetical protein
MAKLDNLDSVLTASAGTTVKVGHNRTITREVRRDGTVSFWCRLHGSPVVIVTPQGSSGRAIVKLDTWGYLTTTTVAAMRDFMRAFGIKGNASRAGGKLSARWVCDGGWHEEDADDGKSMVFVADM